MSKPSSFGRAEIDVAVGRQRTNPTCSPETPFRIAVLGDFSGRASRGLQEAGAKLASRPARRVDCDNFQEVLRKSEVELRVALHGADAPPVSWKFIDVDDFHPDRIFQRLDLFAKLRKLRGRLADLATFAEAAAELGLTEAEAPTSQQAPPRAEQPSPHPDISPLIKGRLLDDMVAQAEASSAGTHVAPARDPFRDTVEQIVAPHVVAGPRPEQQQVLARVDQAATGLMRAVLHLPPFQALEAAWRSVWFLISRLESHAQLRLELIDVSKDELLADLLSSSELSRTGTYRLLVEQTVETPGAEPWAVIVGDYTFDWAATDVELLKQLARIAATAGTPFLAAASPSLLGCESLAAIPDPRDWKPTEDSDTALAWQALRHLPEASYLGLALPRLLLRLPYGKRTQPIEEFDFEEMPSPPEHDRYLWGNPAFACALLLAETFSVEGWRMRAGFVREVGGLPLHIYTEDGETRSKPCAEVLLTERAVEAILDGGIMPLVAPKGQDSVRLVRFQSLADPPAPLAGPWARG